MPSRVRPYYPYARNQQQQGGGDWERGIQAGAQMGKLLGGLGEAITNARSQAQQDKVANQLLAQNYPDQQTDPNFDPNADLSTDLPEDVGTDIGGTASEDTTPGNFQGGLAELKLRQEAAKNDLDTQRLQGEIAKSKAAANLATLRSGLVAQGGNQPQAGNAGAWSGYTMNGGGNNQPPSGRGGGGGKSGQPEAPVQIGSEPVTSQGQLVNHFDGTYGKGAFSKVISNLNSAAVSDDGKYVSIGPEGKALNIPMTDAQAYVKQQNALRLKQGLTPFPVPGEDASLGSSATNPYPTKNNLDVYSRPPGSWVTLPNGKIAQVPNR